MEKLRKGVTRMPAAQDRPLVSVVIPAYNAEKTVERLLDSVLGQTWEQLQVFLVDDGSTDRTAEIADRAAEKDPRLTVIRMENGGVSAARNAGLARCEGKYIRFADADDTMPADSIERMVRRAEADGSGFVIGGYEQYFGRKHSRHNLADRNDTVACDDILDHLCNHANSYFYGVLWNKLFLRETVVREGCSFREGLVWGEDFAFVMDYLAGTDIVSFMKDVLYDYRRTAKSATVRQVVDCVRRPVVNTRIKLELYSHLKSMYIRRGQYEKYRKRLWIYLLRVGLG